MEIKFTFFGFAQNTMHDSQNTVWKTHILSKTNATKNKIIMRQHGHLTYRRKLTRGKEAKNLANVSLRSPGRLAKIGNLLRYIKTALSWGINAHTIAYYCSTVPLFITFNSFIFR